MLEDDRATVEEAGSEVDLEPNETKETVSWLILTDSVDEAQHYRMLGEVCELP